MVHFTMKDIHFFYFPDIPDQGAFETDGPELHHMTRVLRHKAGDQVNLCDGKGKYFTARLEAATKSRGTFEILTAEVSESTRVPLTVAIAPTKNMVRFEWFLEKATEIGIGHVVPLLCDHSERKVIKLERCEKIILSAMKQSARAWKPQLSAQVSFSDYVNSELENPYMAHCSEGQKQDIKTLDGSQASTILIGPEGDFSEQEINKVLALGIPSLTLGKSRLRTETAGIMACATLELSRR